MSFARNPSSVEKLISSAQRSVAVANEDLATFIDVSSFEFVKVVVTVVTKGTCTVLTLKGLEDSASNGATAATIKDEAGSDIVKAVTGAELADGKAIEFEFRVHGRKKFFSPQLAATTAACLVAVTIHGYFPRDSSDLEASWPTPASPAPAGRFSTVSAAAATYS